MAENHEEGPVEFVDSEAVEMNLQPFDQATGAVVGDKFEQIFTSTYADNGATSATFGANARPYVCDVNGDGLFDLVVVGIAEGSAISKTNVYLNVGGEGNPQFVESRGGLGEAALPDASTNLLAGVTVDVAPQGAVSVALGDVDQDGVQDLLVSDEEGRIWFYKGTKTTTETSATETEGTTAETAVAGATGFTVEVDSFAANPGHVVEVPVRVATASEVAYAAVEMKYDPQVVVCTRVSAGDASGVRDIFVADPVKVSNGMVRSVAATADVKRLESAFCVASATSLASLTLADGDAIQAGRAAIKAAFESGKVGIKVTPGEGNQIVANINTGYVHVYGTDDLSKAMTLIEQVGFDMTPYLKEATKGEGTLTVTLGTHTFLKVLVGK